MGISKRRAVLDVGLCVTITTVFLVYSTWVVCSILIGKTVGLREFVSVALLGLVFLNKLIRILMFFDSYKKALDSKG